MDERPSWLERVRSWLGIGVVTWGIIGVTAFAIAIVVVADAGEKLETTKLLLASILPLLGTWVGTVLAYYFAKENLESATRTTKELAGLDEKLRSVPVATAMIPIERADTVQLKKGQDPETLVLKDLLQKMDTAKRNRLPVLDNKGAAVYVIHRSSLTELLAQQAITAAAGATPTPLTIASLKSQRADLFNMISTWACVKRTASLADAKLAMETIPRCSDAFVTESGQRSEPVIGWITNVEISLHCRA